MAQIISDTTKPEPALYGLLSSAVTVVDDDSPYWVNHMQYETAVCGALVRLQSVCSASQTVTSQQQTDGTQFLDYYPFSVQVDFQCSTMSRTPDELEEKAREALEACTQKSLEKEFWDGALTKLAKSQDAAFPNRYLASSDTIDVTPTPGTGIKAKYAIAKLEQAIANCGCGIRGTIHVTRDVASTLGLSPTDGHLETHLGNYVVAGSGYSGNGPNGNPAPAGMAWAYATGPVSVRLGPPAVLGDMTSQRVRLADNTTIIRTERPAAVTWNACCHYAVLIDLSLDYA